MDPTRGPFFCFYKVYYDKHVQETFIIFSNGIIICFCGQPKCKFRPNYGRCSDRSNDKDVSFFHTRLRHCCIFLTSSKKSQKSGYRMRRVLCNSLCIWAYSLDL